MRSPRPRLRWLRRMCLLLAGAAGLAGAAALDEEQRREVLAAHNRWRAGVGVPPLVWSQALAQSADRWAAQLDQGGKCELSHSDAPGLGENLYWASPVRWSTGLVTLQALRPAFVVDAWGGESADYQPESGACRAGRACGHYTQVVWRDTREVGCARQVCGGVEQVWVCQYLPAGNVLGQRPF